MTGENFGHLAYLTLLFIAVGGWFLAEARGNLGKSAKQALIWGVIFVGIVAIFGLWSGFDTSG